MGGAIGQSCDLEKVGGATGSNCKRETGIMDLKVMGCVTLEEAEHVTGDVIVC